MAQILDGKAFAGKLRETIAQEVAALQQKGITPGLAVVLVGSDPASEVYVRNKGKQTKEAGMTSFEHKLPEETTQEELLSLIQKLNEDETVHGILVQLPLPKQIDADTVLNSIAPEKDADGFHPMNVGRFSTGGIGTVPCTPLGSLMLLKDHLGDLSGSRALVLGRSNIVGKPMANLLLNENCTVTIAHSRTKDLEEECRRADILVAAVGRPEMVKESWNQAWSHCYRRRYHRIDGENGKTRLGGDVDFAGASNNAGAITPVPGGIGPRLLPACC